MPTLTTEQLLEQAFSPAADELEQATGNGNNNNPKPASSKAIGINVAVINQTKQDATLFIGSAFSIDIGFLEPYQFEKGLPQQNGESLKAQIFHLSIQRQHEEYALMRDIADKMLANNIREHTLNWDELDASKYPFTLRTWKNSGMVWHFTNRKLGKKTGEKLTADKVAEVLAEIL